MKDENVTFSGKEAEKLFSVAELSTVVKMLESGKPEIARLTHNCTNTALLDLFGSVEIGDSKDAYFGLPVYRRGWVPLGEIWLQDKNGQVLRKFSIPHSSE